MAMEHRSATGSTWAITAARSVQCSPVVYNIGGDSEKRNLEVVQAICKAVDTLRPGLPHAPCTSLISYVKDRPGHDRRYAIDFGKIEGELGWRPSLSFDEAISRTVGWYLDNGPWIENIASGGYRRNRLGLVAEVS